MIKMLASVTGPAEAAVALAGGADFIDLKDPAQGALGAVSPAVLAATLETVAGRRPVSAVAGDLPMQPAVVAEAVAARRAAAFVKIGLFPAPAEARRAVIAGLAAIAAETRLIAVFFADGDPDFSLLDDLRAAGFHGAMIDTLGKANAGLLRHLPAGALGGFVERCRALGLVSGLAGSLEAPDVPRLAVLQPDYLGFRRALTAGRREDAIDLAAVEAMRALISAENRNLSPREAGEAAAGETDLIFVRDFVQEMEIGAYGFERGRRQTVRFSVEADVLRAPVRPGVVADIYSYDLIMDAVRSLVAAGHTDFVETLAEELAATLLGDRRLRAVTVRVEKLQLGPGAVGIEIRRARPA
jgi:(5-formylfuran-3-yl)methyl phosphate synthase